MLEGKLNMTDTVEHFDNGSTIDSELITVDIKNEILLKDIDNMQRNAMKTDVCKIIENIMCDKLCMSKCENTYEIASDIYDAIARFIK